MEVEVLDTIVLKKDLPSQGLKAGDVGAVVEKYGSRGIEVEFVTGAERLAPVLGFSGYQPLIRAYVGQGMRQDLRRLEKDRVSALLDSLRRHGVSEKLIATALDDINGESAA